MAKDQKQEAFEHFGVFKGSELVRDTRTTAMGTRFLGGGVTHYVQLEGEGFKAFFRMTSTESKRVRKEAGAMEALEAKTAEAATAWINKTYPVEIAPATPALEAVPVGEDTPPKETGADVTPVKTEDTPAKTEGGEDTKTAQDSGKDKDSTGDSAESGEPEVELDTDASKSKTRSKSKK